MKVVPPAVFVRDTGTPKGRGVFAAKPFLADEVVEVCPVVPFSTVGAKLPVAVTCLIFSWSYLVTGQVGPLSVLALGYGSLYNHNNPANMRYEADATNQVLRFIAVRAITADEELTVNYNAHGGGAEWGDDAWFDRKRIKPIIDA